MTTIAESSTGTGLSRDSHDAPPASADDRSPKGSPSESPDRPDALVDVVRAIPEECYENPTWRGLAALARDATLYVLVLYALVLVDSPWILVPLWALSGLVVSALFILAHDAAHGSLFGSRRLNSLVGHLAMLPAWHVYEGWVLGHNRLHHGHTVRQGMDFVWHPLTPAEFAALGRWKQLRHKIEWSPIGGGLYYMRDVWWNKMIAFDPPAKWRDAIRSDRRYVGVFVLLAGIGLGWVGWVVHSSLAGAVWTVVKALVGPFVAFCFVIGFVVHLHHIDPKIRWWPRREWTRFKGQMEGTTVLWVPRWLNFFLHNIFVHTPHHVDMRIPYYHLPAAHEAIKAAFPGVVEERPFSLRDFVENTKVCKLYDFEAGRWLTYEEGERYLRDGRAGLAEGHWVGTTRSRSERGRSHTFSA